MKLQRLIGSVLLAISVSASLSAQVGMTWTPGGYTATDHFSPPTAANGTLTSTVTPTSMSATMVTNPANGVLGALYFDGNFTSGPLVSQALTLAFDVTVLDQPANATAQPKNLDLSLLGGSSSAGTAGIMLGMNIYASAPGDWAFRFAIAPTSATGGVLAMRSTDNTTLLAFGNYTVGASNHVVLQADYTTGLLQAHVDGNYAGQFNMNVASPAAVTSEVFIHLNGELGNANAVTIEQFSASTSVPDAGSTVALLAGALGVVGALRRHSRARR
jgi:hypothetical protein